MVLILASVVLIHNKIKGRLEKQLQKHVRVKVITAIIIVVFYYMGFL